MLCLVLQYYRALKQDTFQGSLWLYILEVKAYHLKQLSCIVNYIVAVEK